MSAVGDAIRAARHAKGLTLADVSAELGVSIPYLSDVELGHRRISQPRLIHLAAIIDINLRALLVASAVDTGFVDVSALTPTQVAKVVALAERLRATTTEDL